MATQAKLSTTILAQYAEGPALLESALAGLTESDLDLALSVDSWSIRQIVHHIADGDDIWKTCIKAALGNSDGLFTLQWYWDKPQMVWSENWTYASRGIESSLALLCANRRHIMESYKEFENEIQISKVQVRMFEGMTHAQEFENIEQVLPMILNFIES